MTAVTHSASQRRSLSPPAARRSTTALTSPRPKIRSRRRADATAPAHDRTRSPAVFPPTRLRATGLRSHVRDPFAILKSP